MLSRRTFMKFGMSATAALMAAGCGTQAQVEMLSVEQLTLPVAQLKAKADGFKIVLMSDFHARTNSDLSLYESAVDMTNAMQPDLVVLPGDFVNSGPDPIRQLSPILGQIQSTYGVYASMGNHEYDSDPQTIIRSLEQHDIPMLRNSGTVIGDELLYLAALDDVWFERHNIQRALTNRPADLPTVLLSHEPDIADQVAETGSVALQMSGHSHGGQIRMPLVGAPMLPQYGQKYDMGLYQVQDMWLYTTRGIGTNNLPYRLNCPPEITEITLTVAGAAESDAI